jgi:xanthine dehydrogenase YagR molybdenum-binding subunit
MNVLKDAVQAVMKEAIALAPDSWLPGGRPDPVSYAKHGLIGRPVSRLDGALKVKGEARFAAEIAVDGLTYAALVYSTIARGRILSIETSAANAAPGVVLVMTHRNAPRLRPVPYFMEAPKSAAGDNLPVLQDDQVHWNGQPVALILAMTQEQADHAKSLVKVQYEEFASTTSFSAAKAHGEAIGDFQGEKLDIKIGEPDSAFAAAHFQVDATYITPRHNHNAIEPHAVTVVWEGDHLRVHDATQAVGHTAWSIGHAFGLDEKQVHVTSPYVGGGFGGKCLWQHQLLAAAAAKVANQPVRLALSREGVFRIIGGRTNTEQRVAIAANEEGRFQSLIQTGVVAMGRHNNVPEPFISSAQSAYAIPNMRLQVRTSAMDMVANTFMRAPGEAVGTFALESAIDELAHKMGIDPVDLRIRNEPEKDPTSGLPFSSRHIVEAFQVGADRFGWSQRNPRPGQRRDGEWLIGMGTAKGTYPYYRMPGGAAKLTLTRNGDVTVEFAAHEMGMGTATTHAMVTAERMGLPLENINVKYADSQLPGLILAGGSQQTASVGASIIAAHRKLVDELLKLAGNDSPLAGLSAEEVGGSEGGLCSLKDPGLHESYASILARASREEISVEAEAAQPLELMHWSMHSHSALFCEVRVNSITGEVRVGRFLGSFDCGRIINAKTAASQFRGGIIMGLGLALMEETQFDERTGRITGASFAEYHVPVHLDVPEIDVIWTDIPDPHSPMGARGVGEIGITGVGAVVANAVFNATGKRIRKLPITLEKLL